MKTILITGGCGFLGSWTVKSLLEAGYLVKIFDIKIDKKMLKFACGDILNKVEFIQGDILNILDVQNAATGCSAIVHLAGVMTVDCEKNPILGAKINVLGSLNVFEAAKINNITKVVYLSSAGVYGPNSGAEPEPQSHYGAFKLAIEGSARAYWNNQGISSIGLRPYIIYGAGASRGLSAGPSHACLAAYQNKPFEIGFSGNVGFVYVEDVANSLVAAVESDFTGAHTSNLSGEEASVVDFVDKLKQQVPQNKISINGAPFQIASSLTNENNIGFLENLPITTVSQGIAQTLDHYKKRNF